jgi:hypothetical protein
VVVGEESATNWDWFIQWLRKEVVGADKIIVILYQDLVINVVLRDQILYGRNQHARLFIIFVLNTLYKICIIIVV